MQRNYIRDFVKLKNGSQNHGDREGNYYERHRLESDYSEYRK